MSLSQKRKILSGCASPIVAASPPPTLSLGWGIPLYTNTQGTSKKVYEKNVQWKVVGAFKRPCSIRIQSGVSIIFATVHSLVVLLIGSSQTEKQKAERISISGE